MPWEISIQSSSSKVLSLDHVDCFTSFRLIVSVYLWTNKNIIDFLTHIFNRLDKYVIFSLVPFFWLNNMIDELSRFLFDEYCCLTSRFLGFDDLAAKIVHGWLCMVGGLIYYPKTFLGIRQRDSHTRDYALKCLPRMGFNTNRKHQLTSSNRLEWLNRMVINGS